MRQDINIVIDFYCEYKYWNKYWIILLYISDCSLSTKIYVVDSRYDVCIHVHINEVACIRVEQEKKEKEKKREVCR